jgi:hypothetical protein
VAQFIEGNSFRVVGRELRWWLTDAEQEAQDDSEHDQM